MIINNFNSLALNKKPGKSQFLPPPSSLIILEVTKIVLNIAIVVKLAVTMNF